MFRGGGTPDGSWNRGTGELEANGADPRPRWGSCMTRGGGVSRREGNLGERRLSGAESGKQTQPGGR